MKQQASIGALVTLLVVYAGVMGVVVAPLAIGANEGLHVAYLLLATTAFLGCWRYLTRGRSVKSAFAFGAGVWAGVAVGIVEFALAVTAWPNGDGAATALRIAAFEFGATFAVLAVCFLTRPSSGSGLFLTRKYRIDPWLALAGGMWLGAVAWLLVFVAVMMSYGVRGTLSG